MSYRRWAVLTCRIRHRCTSFNELTITIVSFPTDGYCDASLNEIRDRVHHTVKLGSAGDDLDTLQIFLAQLLLSLGSLALEAVDVLEVFVAIRGRCLKYFKLVSADAGFVDERPLNMGTEDGGACLGRARSWFEVGKNLAREDER